MSGSKRRVAIFAITAILLFSLVLVLNAAVPAVKDDPLVRMPGTQPGQVTLEAPNRCLNCHADYNTSVEPGFNWMGSMMAQSARDFLYFPAVTVAAQDAMWVTKGITGEASANATDICLRCHFPKGWLEGRSDPTNASLMKGADWDGVQCDFCHSMWDPQFEATHLGMEGYVGNWDEVGLDWQIAEEETYAEDQALAQTITFYNGEPFFVDNSPSSAGYTEGTGGQYFVSSDGAKRASFVDAEARHQMLYSRYHKSKYFCGTCHDVSNPVLANLWADSTNFLPTELNSAYDYYHVERTFSEFMLSDYGQDGGAAGIGPYSPDQFETSNPGNVIDKCQDCHMRDVIGTGADKNGVPVRPTDSLEHPESGQPLHDFTGGNIWVPTVLASSVPGSPNYNDVPNGKGFTNDDMLNQGAAVLTLDLAQGQGLDPEALLAGAERARQQLELAAAIEGLSFNSGSGDLSFRIQNQTGHKLISGFPEGRRMFLNVQAFANGSLVYEINPYDSDANTLKGLGYNYKPGMGLPDPTDIAAGSEAYVDGLVYEVRLSTDGAKTQHVVMADGRVKDNRIPPKGFRSEEADLRLAESVPYNGEVYFGTDEYAGGYDAVNLNIPVTADSVQVSLYYQTTSREFIEFLRDEINGPEDGIEYLTLPVEAYVVQTDPFFSQLRVWGDTIWDLWLHNKDLPGAAPVLMAQVTTGDGGGGGTGCTPPDASPAGLTAVPGNGELTLGWSEAADVTGYRLYYDQADKTQPVADLPAGTLSYVDTGLTNGQLYCYVITAYNIAGEESCESAFSAPVCATPNNAGQAPVLTVASLTTGIYSGKGSNRTFVPITDFNAGDEVVVRAYVIDMDTGLPASDVLVDVTIFADGTAVQVLSGVTDKDGLTEVKWATQAPSRKKPGTPPGPYLAMTTSVAGSGYLWDGSMATVDFWIN